MSDAYCTKNIMKNGTDVKIAAASVCLYKVCSNIKS